MASAWNNHDDPYPEMGVCRCHRVAGTLVSHPFVLASSFSVAMSVSPFVAPVCHFWLVKGVTNFLEK
jgi:hypothetical protein